MNAVYIFLYVILFHFGGLYSNPINFAYDIDKCIRNSKSITIIPLYHHRIICYKNSHVQTYTQIKEASWIHAFILYLYEFDSQNIEFQRDILFDELNIDKTNLY